MLGKKNTDTSIFYDVSYLQDNRMLYGNLTGYDHFKFVCQMQGIPLAKIKQVTDRVGMSPYVKQRVNNYSLGMKQHLLLAMVIINKPKLLLMDEPFNGLDPTSAINMRNILLELHKEGTTIIISSHNLDEIDRLTSTIYFLKDRELLKESLHDFSTNKYSITPQDLHQAETVLNQAGIQIAITDHTIEFQEESTTSLQVVIDHLNEANITIKAIDKTKIGAEKRYQELFEGTHTT